MFDLAAFAVSRDHKPDQTDERQRIEEAGGFVMWAGNCLCVLSFSTLFSSVFCRRDGVPIFSSSIYSLQALGESGECLQYLVHLVIDY